MLTTNEYRAGVGAHWTFLSDVGRKVQKDLGDRARGSCTRRCHDPACHRPRTWSRYIQDLQRLLVFWPTDHRRASASLACRVEEMPSRLGHYYTRTESRLGTP